MSAVVVVGNPKPASRTGGVGVAVAEAVLARSGTTSPAVQVIELSSLATSLFSWGDPDVAAAKATVLEAELLVVASPVYKASYTGLLKAFVDQFGRDELAALATVPVMVGAAPAHTLAVETQLRPVLVEIGGSCPTRGVYVLEKQSADSAGVIDEWLAVWGGALIAVMQAGKQGQQSKVEGRPA
jgi:FMN reductase